MSTEFVAYLESSRIKSWHDDHLREFRDALAHRIPLYIPPYLQDLSTGETRIADCFIGSLTTGTVMRLHQQILADFNTVHQMIERFIEFEIPAALK